MTTPAPGLFVTTPQLQYRDEQHYASVLQRVSPSEMASVLPALWQEVRQTLKFQNATPVGAPFIRFVITDSDAEHEIEAGVRVVEAIRRHDRVRPGVLPAGCYATLEYSGPFDGLHDAHVALASWVSETGVAIPSWPAENGIAWRARTASFHNEDCFTRNPDGGYIEMADLVTGAPDPECEPQVR